MGTSISQPSPRTTGWKSVGQCYTDSAIPVDRAATEIWRAALHQDKTILEQIQSKLVDAFLRIGETAPNTEVATKAISKVESGNKNTLIGEFAKRAAMVKVAGGFPKESVRAVLFRQITNYLVSRDVAGYVGPSYRCKTIKEIGVFKQELGEVIAARISQTENIGKGKGREWPTAASALVDRLQK